MKKELFSYLVSNSGTLTPKQVLLNFAAVLILSLCIYISYKYSYSKLVYSARFNVSLVILALISTLVMSCIGNNVALSLGMVGALSIVRFRTSVKDARDTAYIFWAIAVGICCGISDYQIAIIGTVFIFVLILIFGNVQNNTRYLLVVRSSREASKQVKDAIDSYYNKKAIFRTDNSNRNENELIYIVSSGVIKNAEKKNGTLNDVLDKIPGVIDINMVSQNNEMNV